MLDVWCAVNELVLLYPYLPGCSNLGMYSMVTGYEEEVQERNKQKATLKVYKNGPMALISYHLETITRAHSLPTPLYTTSLHSTSPPRVYLTFLSPYCIQNLPA